jgi:hypothetical protein
MPVSAMPEGDAPRLVAIDPAISLVVSDVPSSVYNAEALESRLGDLDWVSLAGAAHHAVVDSLAESGHAIIPFRLFTIFSSESMAVATLGEMRQAMRDAFARVRNRQEWVLRIGKPDPSRIARPQDEPAAARASGTNFLQAKADARREAAARTERVKKDTAAAFAALAPLADAATTRAVDPAGTLLLDAAFLVPGSRIDEMRQALTAAAAGLLRDGCAVSLTGPWPPYSFASMDSGLDG